MTEVTCNRKSPRLMRYDYSQEGSYFITICVQERKCFFGKILDGAMQLNEAGSMIGRWWVELERKFPSIKNDIFVVMPNHFHGIVFIQKANIDASPNKGAHIGAPLQTMVQWFKTMTTNEYLCGIKERGWPPFNGNLWQRSFYDHVIRDEASLNRIREYIMTNPQRWDFDRENPKAMGKDDFDLWLASFNYQP